MKQGTAVSDNGMPANMAAGPCRANFLVKDLIALSSIHKIRCSLGQSKFPVKTKTSAPVGRIQGDNSKPPASFPANFI
jgi:hypothetical protein